MGTLLQRALMPFAFIGTLMSALLVSLPELRNPVSLGLLALTALLMVLRPIEREMRTSSRIKKRLLLIGHGLVARKFMDEIERYPQRGFTILGVVEESPSLQTQRSPYLVLGTIHELQTIVAAVKPEVIVLALSDRRGRMPAADLLEFQSNGIVVEDVADAYEHVSGKLPIEVVTPGQLLASQRLRKSRLLKGAQRALSFTAALILLAIFSPMVQFCSARRAWERVSGHSSSSSSERCCQSKGPHRNGFRTISSVSPDLESGCAFCESTSGHSSSMSFVVT